MHSGYSAEGHGWTVGGGGQASTASVIMLQVMEWWWTFNTDGSGTSVKIWWYSRTRL